MSTLHTINKSPFERSSLTSCLDHVAEGDAVLIFEDGVVGARKGCAFAEALRAKQTSCAIYILGPDLAARGMKSEDIAEGIGDRGLRRLRRSRRGRRPRLRVVVTVSADVF